MSQNAERIANPLFSSTTIKNIRLLKTIITSYDRSRLRTCNKRYIENINKNLRKQGHFDTNPQPLQIFSVDNSERTSHYEVLGADG